ncbi:4Fe-4S binding protein [bacterium]|nr:4Fe-4S binding protein [bacterium]
MPTEEIYRRLQQEIDKFPVPYPRTESGTEIKLLKLLFTPKEAEIAIHLSLLPESLQRIQKRVHRNGIKLQADELKEILDGLVDKGAILGKGIYETHGKKNYFSLAPFAIGFFENQVDIITRPFAENAEKLMEESFHHHLFGEKKAQLRTIPISTAVTPEVAIEPYDSIRSYVANYKDKIVVINCVCEQSQRARDIACSRTDLMERCLVFGDAARFVLSRGIGRVLTNDEALDALNRAEQENLVLQPQNSQNPGFICCCCAECCGALMALRLLEKPGQIVQSNYQAKIKTEECSDCEECVEICPMQAILMDSGEMRVNKDRCIGCGICVPNCPSSAISLRKKEQLKIPKKTSTQMYREMMFNRFGILPTIKSYLKYLMGMKI